jgi:hypothetical protein
MSVTPLPLAWRHRRARFPDSECGFSFQILFIDPFPLLVLFPLFPWSLSLWSKRVRINPIDWVC